MEENDFYSVQLAYAQNVHVSSMEKLLNKGLGVYPPPIRHCA